MRWIYLGLHCDRFITSCAPYILTVPSAEQVARINPRCFGPNLTSVTLVLLSTKLVFFTQWFSPPELFSPTISSHTAAVLSKEQVAITWPNSGCAQVTFHTEPLWVFQDALQFQLPASSWSQTFTFWSLEQ